MNRIIIREFRIESPRQVIIVNASPLLDRNHQCSGAVLVARDITRISELESELKEKIQLSQYHRQKQGNAAY
ncbi:MAG: hypothetical protein HC887_08350, partial [Desulfobacteraceae bacterium]|nr:hypothetical protein [Desulfobacteraceae bacterium]